MEVVVARQFDLLRACQKSNNEDIEGEARNFNNYQIPSASS
jgi:hypothetical protein